MSDILDINDLHDSTFDVKLVDLSVEIEKSVLSEYNNSAFIDEESCKIIQVESPKKSSNDVGENESRATKDLQSLFQQPKRTTDYNIKQSEETSTANPALLELCIENENPTKNDSIENEIQRLSQSLEINASLEDEGDRRKESGDKSVRRATCIGIAPSKSIGSVKECSPGKILSKRECTLCKICVPRRFFAKHLKSNLHKTNVLRSRHVLDNVEIVQNVFGQRLLTYRVKNTSQRLEGLRALDLVLVQVRDTLIKLIEQTIRELPIFKTNFIFHADFVLGSRNVLTSVDFQTPNYVISQGDDHNIFLNSLRDEIITKVDTENKMSGGSLKRINSFDMNINKFNPLIKGFDILPKKITVT